MREVVNKVAIYQFRELDEKAKEKAKEIISKTIIDERFMHLQEDLKEILLNDYNVDADVYYSLCYSQGDGLHFITKNLLNDYVVNEIKKDLTIAEKKTFSLMLKNGEIAAFTQHNNNHYEYASKYDVKVDYRFKENKFKRSLIDKIEDKLITIYLEICCYLEKIGYSCYEVTNEDIEETIYNNELEFYVNGEIY